MKDKPYAWAQAAVDVDDIVLGIQIAEMALEEGAEWIEVGTPLIYKYGHSAIGMMRKALGDKAILVADYKFLIPWDCMREAEKQGADYAIFEAGYHIDIMERTMREAEQLRINPIFCLSVHPKEFTFYADLYAEMGVRYFFTHHFYTVLDSETHTPVKYNNAISFSMCKRPIQFCITNDDFDQVPDSIRSGADWITFGKAIHSLDRSTCRKWVKMIHSTRRT